MRKSAIVFLLIAALEFTQVICYAQQSEETKQAVNPAVKRSSQAPAASPIDSLRYLLKEEQKRSNALKMSLSVSFKGDESGGENDSKLKTAAEISKGEYPRQLRFKEKSDIEFEDNKINEDVTMLLLNYDYYIAPSIEVYAFLERFKDSYMGIKNRYEIGFGALCEIAFFGSVKRKENTEKKIENLFERLPTTLSVSQKDSLSRDKKTALTSIKKHNSRLTVGLALSFFRELEQPDEIMVPAGAIDSAVSVGSETRFRVVFRPSINYHATNELTLSGFCYLKAPAFHPQRVDSKYDYRIDAQFSAKLALSNDEQKNGKVSLSFIYEFRYDNVPPSVELNGERTVANDFHGTTTLEITVEI